MVVVVVVVVVVCGDDDGRNDELGWLNRLQDTDIRRQEQENELNE